MCTCDTVTNHILSLITCMTYYIEWYSNVTQKCTIYHYSVHKTKIFFSVEQIKKKRIDGDPFPSSRQAQCCHTLNDMGYVWIIKFTTCSNRREQNS